MRWPERFVRDHKRQTDRAINRACAGLGSDPFVFKTFLELLSLAQARAPRLFDAPLTNGRHPGIDALINLARFHDSHIRPASTWSGTDSSWQRAVASMANHLVCRYEVPRFLASCWYATNRSGDSSRRWFIAHARGASFRSLGLPLAMTRKMEHLFLASSDHLSIEHAMRRAELLSLGMPAPFLAAILATRLVWDLDHSDFWRTVWFFLLAHADVFDPAQIGPMIDYIQAIRHDQITMQADTGSMTFSPINPEFTMKGRTVQSMMRLIGNWHRALGTAHTSFSWQRSPLQPFLYVEPPTGSSENSKRWQLIELTNSEQLRSEGTALRHCVASYAWRCQLGSSSIWSLRMWKGETMRHVLTVEMNPKTRTVVQARGFVNRRASGKPLRLLQDWAGKEGLRLAL